MAATAGRRAWRLMLGKLDTLGDGLEAGKVNHRVDSVLLKNLLECPGITHITVDKSERLAGDRLNPSQGFLAGITQVIYHHHLVAYIQQFQTSVRADIAGPASNQNGFHLLQSFV